MARYLKLRNGNVFVDGFHLLALIEKLIHETRLAPDLAGTGAANDPYVMDSASDWITRWKASTHEAVIYYKLAGRLITKNKRVYIGDAGPAYLQGASILEAACKSFRSLYGRLPRLRTETGFLMTIRLGIEETQPGVNSRQVLRQVTASGTPPANWTAVVLSKVVEAAAKISGGASNDSMEFFHAEDRARLQGWMVKNSHRDPEYQLLAQRMVDPGLIYDQSRQALAAGRGVPRAISWNDITRSPVIAGAIRKLMKGEKLALGKDYSRMQFLLPVTTMAIFHAEPARNARAWPINLMVLDLAEASTPNFTWGAILWHPLAIPRDATTGVGMPVPPQTVIHGPIGNGRAMGQIDNTLKLHLVGGILPASPTKGGEIGGKQLFKPAKPLTAQAILHNAKQGHGDMHNSPYDFIHQKEVDVVLRWLTKFPIIAGAWEVADPADGGAVLLNSQAILSRIMPNDQVVSNSLRWMGTILSNRIESLDRM
ncbi:MULTISPECIES: hypothetical protein [unclassified Duganella]|uniref:hypothetical protein n=1 Tax=unclassified Duganella TaxID=2636909 RepID=UPI0006F30145|nr:MULTISPECIES: hypothetical protein [unclassified Duganella]KQV61447.1 hypothetical protein ASD07_00860 [Duganella sp. Root336D2]KRB92462.1 hypothetical protein ASE26_05715 [Duganella sp. Root198D2]